jgi:Effector-associated domain 1
MQLTAEQYRQLNKAFISAFPKRPELERMVRFRLNENLDAIAGGANLTEVVFNLISWAESQERLEELLIGARKENPGNSLLKAVSEKVLAISLGAPQDRLEAIIHGSKFRDVEPWLECIRQCSLTVCRIEMPIGTAKGTGFLLGSDLIISTELGRSK